MHTVTVSTEYVNTVLYHTDMYTFTLYSVHSLSKSMFLTFSEPKVISRKDKHLLNLPRILGVIE